MRMWLTGVQPRRGNNRLGTSLGRLNEVDCRMGNLLAEHFYSMQRKKMENTKQLTHFPDIPDELKGKTPSSFKNIRSKSSKTLIIENG